MGLFSRKRSQDAPSGADSGPADDTGDSPEVVETTARSIDEAERTRIDEALATVRGEGVDVDDLQSISDGLDAAYREWEGTRSGPHDEIVDRYALVIGDYLERHTDLDWKVVTDVFGTDLAVAGGFGTSFVAVPHNLVAGRWMRGETGWVPGVIGHMVRLRRR